MLGRAHDIDDVARRADGAGLAQIQGIPRERNAIAGRDLRPRYDVGMDTDGHQQQDEQRPTIRGR
jgi:hypothetical protein